MSGAPSTTGDAAARIAELEAELEVERARRLAHESHAAAESARYRELMEQTPVGILIDVEGELGFVNAEAARMLGSTPAALIGTQILDLIHPGDRAERAERQRRVLEERRANAMKPVRLLHRDGSTVFADMAGAPVTFEGRRASQVVTVDRTEQRRAAHELTQLRAAVETSGEIIFLTDREGLISYVNPEFTRAYGWTSEEVVGKQTPRILKSGALSPESYATFWSRILQKQIARGEYTNVSKDGGHVDVDASASPILDGAGVVIGFLAVQSDITERRRRDEQLRLTQFAVDHAGDAVFWIDRGGRILYANDQACASLGYSRDELLEIPAAELEACAPPRSWPEVWAALEERRSIAAESVCRTKDGREIPVAVSANFVAFAGKEYAFLFARDISDRVELSSQLHHAQKMEAVGRLAGGVAHDFNNLLSVVLSFAGFVLEELKESDPLRSDVEEIQKAAERAAAVARQLLVFSRREMVRPIVLSLNQVLADLEKLLHRILGEGLELLTVPGAELWPVKMDPGQLEQILANLAVNAKDAMQSGGRLTIATSNVVVTDSRASGLAPGRYVRLEVRDTGSGMTAETAARAFDPFFTTKPKGKGTGLGLSIVYGIVKQAGGDVKLRTAPQKGTCFEIELPALEQGTLTTAPASLPAPDSGRGQTILVVEDEDAVRMLAARILLRAGYKVLEARNAGEAILICERGEPLDLLLTDVVMPQMSGKGLAERLLRERPDLPVLYMSGHSDNALTSDGVLDATVRLLEKPFTRDSLLRSVSTSLAHGRPRTLPFSPG